MLRRGLAVSPELRTGIAFTVGMAVATAVGRLVMPVLIQQILDKGVTGTERLPARLRRRRQRRRPRHHRWWSWCSAGPPTSAWCGRPRRCCATCGSQAFAHIHRLSIADHNESKRGELTARVTSDVETIARFAQWGGVAWIVDSVIIVGTLGVMAIYSWQLTLVTVVVMAPLLPILRALQRRQLRAYDVVRTRVGQTLSRRVRSRSWAPA